MNENKNEIIRVLYISHERKLGGANRSLLDIVEYMHKKGIEVSVVVLYRGCPLDVELRKIGINTISCVFGWWMAPADWNLFLKACFKILHLFQKVSYFKVAKYIKKNQINVIHSNSSTIDFGALLSKKTGCKHVWHFREFGEKDYNLEYMYGRKRTLEYVNNNSDATVFISRAISDEYPEIINKRIIYDGISDVCFVRNNKDKGSHRVCMFLVSGNLIPGKNQLEVLKAVNIINNKYNLEDKYKVIFAGTTTDLSESKKYYKSLISYKEENLLKNVSFVGYVDNMVSLREEIDVEIVPSICEAYGRVTLEAMASRHVVIASDAGANRELISDNITGFIYKTGNEEELADKMSYCINNLKKLNCLRNTAYNEAYSKHRKEVNCECVLNIYKDII